MLVLKPRGARSAVDVDSRAAFKYSGVLRQWLLHGVFFVGDSLGFFFFFERLHQKLVEMRLH